MFVRLRGQFAIALWDERKQQLVLGRDRFGICPLYWTRQGDWLLFASEIKGLLASGMVPARPDLRGIDHVFTFSALPAPVTCFEGRAAPAAWPLSANHPGECRELRRSSKSAPTGKWIFPIAATRTGSRSASPGG